MVHSVGWYIVSGGTQCRVIYRVGTYCVGWYILSDDPQFGGYNVGWYIVSSSKEVVCYEIVGW